MSIKKNRKRVKYRKFVFKLSAKQVKSIEIFCKKNKTTKNKFIKNAVKNYVKHYCNYETPENYVTENQLNLFDGAGVGVVE